MAFRCGHCSLLAPAPTLSSCVWTDRPYAAGCAEAGGVSPRRRVSRRLLESKDELRGLRYAVWLRESTEGQFDRYGPDAQMHAIRRAAARLGLVESGLTWRVAASGRTVHSSNQFQAMLASARAGEFRVLVCARMCRGSSATCG